MNQVFTRMNLPSNSIICILAVVLISILQACSANLPPVFLNEMNNLVLSENTPVGELIFTLRGYDPENSTIEFGLIGTDLLTVNSQTGNVSVAKQLDHEINNTLNFFVTIEDKIKNGVVGENNLVKVPVTIIVLDENDNPPIFHNVPYNIVVKEDTPINSMIFSKIFVTDVDTIGNAIEVVCVEVPYSVGDCDIFGIEANGIEHGSYQGGIILQQKLNYDVRNEYRIILHATDGELNSTTKVNIRVTDVQNSPPVFTSGMYAEIREDVPVNTLVLTLQAHDGDTGAPRKIAYELLPSSLNFTINRSNGELRTVGPLDREVVGTTNGTIILTVKAKEVTNNAPSTNDPTETLAEVTVVIKDVNDSPPAFNRKEYYVNISEDATIGYILPNLDMTVEDPDGDLNAVFSLRLEDISNMFSIEPELVKGSSAVTIKTNSLLDYEDPNQRKFIILVIAKEMYTNPQLLSTATVTVSVMDTNDNAPTFELQSYSATISELAPFGTYIGNIVAKDRDSGVFGEAGIVYALEGIGAEKFVINSLTGIITVAECNHPGIQECLDFETTRKYDLLYVATDNLGSGHRATVPLTILLTDGNDNPPVFTDPVYEVHIDEGSVKFEPDLIINAKDGDELSHLSYTIIYGNQDGIFSIDSNTGKIRIASNRNITYSADTDKNHIVLVVEVSDSKYTATAEVNILVDDINNHAPMFEKNEYVVLVDEDVEIGSEIIHLEATDADFGLNSELSYYIKKGSFNDFMIDNSTGLVQIAKKLDYDVRNSYNMEVIAMDHGFKTLMGRTMLIVNINNVNNKLPYFKPSIQKVVVMKNIEVGTVVHSLTAFDPDVNSVEALNYFAVPDMITALDKQGNAITLLQYQDLFKIDKRTGNIVLDKSLKYNPAVEIQIPVIVKDITADTIQQGEGMLIVTIMDINNYAPEFRSPWTVGNPIYKLSIQEELPVGTIIETYSATDNDSTIAGYYIKPESEYFEINHGTGILQIKEQIDYENIKELNFTIVTYDSGIPQLNTSATVFVTILDSNDNSPIFSNKEYNVSLVENATNGTHIITVKATDLDSNEFGRVSYGLVGEYSQNFVISATSGEIFVGNSNFLDHEEISECTIQIVAYDNAPKNMRRSSLVLVHIKIVDVNDNAPKFSEKTYTVIVKENILVTPPIPILRVNADDLDKNLYGLVGYKILSGNHNESFLLTEDTGHLFVRKSLHGKTDGFLLKIEARDENGNGEFADEATIQVVVESVNSYKPKFVSPIIGNNTVKLNDSVPANYSLIIVKASDEDYGENGRISYHIKYNGSNVQETREFKIDSTTGELQTKIPLRFQHRKKFEIMVVAKDHGVPIFFEALRNLTVVLSGVNRTKGGYYDLESTNSYHFFVEENSKPNSLIGQVMASPILKEEDLYYYLSASSDKSFYVDKLDGSLYTTKSLDREYKDEYSLLLFASTHPDFYIAAEDEYKILNKTNENQFIRAQVTVTDLNDNSPKFEKESYFAAVNSLTKINTFVSNVQASDPDIGGSLMYYIKASNLFKFGENKSSGAVIPSPFNITHEGDLFTATYLNENAQHHFVVEVVAKESEFTEHEGFSKIYVWIFEANQLIRIILSRPVDEVVKQKNDIIEELSNITKYIVVLNDIKNHLEDNGDENKEWCDMFILVVNKSSQCIVSVDEVLRTIDVKYDFLKDYYAGFAIENVVPAFNMASGNALLDPALIASVGVVFLLGIITVIMICCLRLRSSSTYTQKKDVLINNKGIIEDLTTTENPLWIEQKIKMYEEQELSMQVFNDMEQHATLDKSRDYLQDENAYATIQQPLHHGFVHPDSVLLTSDVGDYATLSSNMFNTTNEYEAALGFQGSTFQVPESSLTSNQDS